MHAYLDVDEVVRLITCKLITSQVKATAIALTCCHKNHEDPVLYISWKTQEMPLPPLSVCRVTSGTEVDGL